MMGVTLFFAEPENLMKPVSVTPPTEVVNEESAPLESFCGVWVGAQVLAGAVAAGYKTATPIQSAAIPVILAGKDVIAQARTGTGKTAAFGLPAMSMLKHNNTVEVLVITPTRELAGQVSDELFKWGRLATVRSVAVYGGQTSGRQVELIRRGAHIIVAAPGRLLDLLESGRLGEDHAVDHYFG